jgi:O-acetylserine/cysteine efflux transporter
LVSWSFPAQVFTLSAVGWLSVLYLAVLSTVVANMILYTLISDRAVSRLSVQLYLVPLVSLIGGILLLGESFSAFTALGACFLFAGTALATHRH